MPIGVIVFAALIVGALGASLMSDVAKRGREDWKEAVGTRDGRIILGLGAVTLIITIAMMVGAHLQILA